MSGAGQPDGGPPDGDPPGGDVPDGPHQGQPVETAGVPLDEADAAVVLTHGRGATARGMLGLADDLGIDGVAYLAPQASRGTWYPRPFTAPVESNEPHLSSALALLDSVVERAAGSGVGDERAAGSGVGDERAAGSGLGHERVVLVGFSQGACLASEYAARNPRRYGGVAALSGGLIGPEGTDFDHEGEMDGTPAFLGCSDDDPHIPLERVHETAEVFERLGADVDERIYEGMGHGVNEDELGAVRDVVSRAAGE